MRKPEILPFGPFKIPIYLLIASILLSGCSYLNDSRQTKTIFAEANDLFYQENYAASLDKYSEIIEKYPAATDRALFEMGIAHAYPKNSQKDYQKSLECFQRLITDYPESRFRQNSETMIFNIRNSALKDQSIAVQQTQIETLQHEIQGKESEIETLQKKIETLEKNIETTKQKLTDYALRKRLVDKMVIEKSKRRLTLISQGEVLKSYKVALGRNPIGPKEQQGDNKTPEGTYIIEGRHKSSRFHLSLRISYPNESDKKRARELGVSPGGNIMIHGTKKDFSWAGSDHAQVDWTEGCIAVTNEEIEEIAKLVLDGTIVEIQP